jgi:DNA (cytosine-5)-methyltransferase 1
MGLDLGFEQGGFEIRVASDINKDALATIRKNRPDILVIPGDIRGVPPDEILEKAELGIGDVTVVIGGPPCQAFSTAGKRLSINDKRKDRGGDLVFKFIEAIEGIRPKSFVFENVAGLISAAEKHVSFYERRNRKDAEFWPDEVLGSAFEKIIDRFKKTRYHLSWGILNAADYGVAQKRKRLIVFGSKRGPPIPPPPRTHVEDIESPQKGMKHWVMWNKSEEFVAPKTKTRPQPWKTLKVGLHGLDDRRPEYVPFPAWGKYLKYLHEGQCWIHLPLHLQEEAMGGAFDTGKGKRAGHRGGRRGFFRRLSWNEPAPTLVTSPIMKATCLCHPTKLRPLSVKEYAKLQGFPDDWQFVGSTEAKYRMIGEAVPVGLANAIARVIARHVKQ